MSAQKPELYTKNELMDKLAQNGLFVGLVTLEEQMSKLKIDPIFENEAGEEMFDVSAYEMLAEVVTTSKVEAEVVQEPIAVQTQPLPQPMAQPMVPSENAFKLDISESTLDMIARKIAKKVVKQVDVIYSDKGDKEQNTAQDEQQEKMNEKLEASEKENQRLRMLLREANYNLNLYKPAPFGLYKFTGKKRREQ